MPFRAEAYFKKPKHTKQNSMHQSLWLLFQFSHTARMIIAVAGLCNEFGADEGWVWKSGGRPQTEKITAAAGVLPFQIPQRC